MTGSPWTDRRVALLRRHYGKDKSASEIAEMVGISRSTVIGKARRLGLSVTREVRREHMARAQLRRYGKRQLTPGKVALVQPKIRKRRSPPGSLPNTTLGITPGFQVPAPLRCQWLHGEPHDRNFCGDPAQPGSSYCPAHHARCRQKPEERRREPFIQAGTN